MGGGGKAGTGPCGEAPGAAGICTAMPGGGCGWQWPGGPVGDMPAPTLPAALAGRNPLPRPPPPPPGATPDTRLRYSRYFCAPQKHMR